MRPLFHQQFNKNKHHKTLASQYHVVSFFVGFHLGLVLSKCEMHDEEDWLNVNVNWIRSFSGPWQSLTSSCSWSSLACVWVAAPGSPGGSRACRCHTAQASVDPGFSCRCHSYRRSRWRYSMAKTSFIIFTLQNFRMYSRLCHTWAKMVDDCIFPPQPLPQIIL